MRQKPGTRKSHGEKVVDAGEAVGLELLEVQKPVLDVCTLQILLRGEFEVRAFLFIPPETNDLLFGGKNKATEGFELQRGPLFDYIHSEANQIRVFVEQASERKKELINTLRTECEN